MKILNENMDYLDLENQLSDRFTIDEYAAKVGRDSDIVTLTFTVKSKLAANDLVAWFEKGYDFVLDASISDGEIKIGQYLVFVELERRARVPKQIVELINELDTLTGMKLSDWTVSIDDEDFDLDADILSQKLILNPNEYRMLNDEEIDKYRDIAGITSKKENKDEADDIKDMKNIAGL